MFVAEISGIHFALKFKGALRTMAPEAFHAEPAELRARAAIVRDLLDNIALHALSASPDVERTPDTFASWNDERGPRNWT